MGRNQEFLHFYPVPPRAGGGHLGPVRSVEDSSKARGLRTGGRVVPHPLLVFLPGRGADGRQTGRGKIDPFSQDTDDPPTVPPTGLGTGYSGRPSWGSSSPRARSTTGRWGRRRPARPHGRVEDPWTGKDEGPGDRRVYTNKTEGQCDTRRSPVPGRNVPF